MSLKGCPEVPKWRPSVVDAVTKWCPGVSPCSSYVVPSGLNLYYDMATRCVHCVPEILLQSIFCLYVVVKDRCDSKKCCCWIGSTSGWLKELLAELSLFCLLGRHVSVTP